jgi:predicted ATPase/DNA-binding CsgD family transcriptional regulator
MTPNLAAGNLPAESNAFIGRERDLADLAGILTRVRAISLCGPGGIGKTRLALKLANDVAGRYPDGVWLADQAAVDRPSQVLPMITNTLGIRAEHDRPLADTLAEALRPRKMLLILDTCDHLVQESAELVQWLLGCCPGLRVVATSREALRVRGEVLWRVPPLGLPVAMSDGTAGSADGQLVTYDAVQLFAARAMAARPRFELNPGNLTVIVDICRQLDGVPLAIELAAARVRTLSLEQIKARLAGRFEFLALGDRTAPPRQQTLRATVDWSYELLTEPERLLLSRLAVFHGWSLEMAEEVCADSQMDSARVLDLLTALIDKSLVSVDYELDGAVRYRLLDTVRQFATEQAAAAGELDWMRQAHRDCMLAMTERVVKSGIVRDDSSWQERVDIYHRAMADWRNCQLALNYCVDHDDAEKGMRLANAMRIAWLVAGDQGGSGWLDRFLLSSAPVRPAVRSRALVVRSEIAFEQQDYEAARKHAQAALDPALIGPGANPAGALRVLGLTALVDGRVDEALAYTATAVAECKKMDDSWEEGITLAVRGAAILVQGDLAEAELVYKQALEALGENRGWGVANVRYGLGRLASFRGHMAEAAKYYQEALALYRQIGARPQMTRCLAGIGQIALDEGDLGIARENLTECVQVSLEIGQRLAIARGLVALAMLANASGDAPTAVKLAGAAQTLYRAIGLPQPESAMRRLDNLLETIRAAQGSSAVAEWLSEGRDLGPHDAARQYIGQPAYRAEPGGLAEPFGSPEPVEPLEPGGPGEPVRDGGESAAQPALAWPGPLTEREREVAILVARGLSNRAIGRELYITQATAARHVANIFSKLGFSSRAQVIAWVVRVNPGEDD